MVAYIVGKITSDLTSFFDAKLNAQRKSIEICNLYMMGWIEETVSHCLADFGQDTDKTKLNEPTYENVHRFVNCSPKIISEVIPRK